MVAAVLGLVADRKGSASEAAAEAERHSRILEAAFLAVAFLVGLEEAVRSHRTAEVGGRAGPTVQVREHRMRLVLGWLAFHRVGLRQEVEHHRHP